MRLLKSTLLRGCNIYYTSTVIRQDVDLGALAGRRSSDAGAGFAERFLARFLDLRKRVPQCAMSEDFIARLRSASGAALEEVLLEAILAVDSAVAFAVRDFVPIAFARVIPGASPERVRLVWDCRIPAMSRRAAAVGSLGVLELLPQDLRPGEPTAEDFKSAFAALEADARRAERSTTTAVLAMAAKMRGLPIETVAGPHLRLGHGAAQRLLYASVPERTSMAAVKLAVNKHRANRRLAEVHLPVARQIKVATAQQAVAAAEKLGYPVVLKPLKQNQAYGVSLGVKSAAEVLAAFERAQVSNQGVLVETFARGDAHRLLVVGGRFVAALKTMPPSITGDGRRTVAELVEELNSDPLRDGVRLFPVPVDQELERDLRLSGYGLGDVLQEGKTIRVRQAANVAIGGMHGDVTDQVHPDNQDMAIRAASTIGLEVAGIDFITEDISRSYREVGGAILEVNARPGLCMHTCPFHGKSRLAAGAVLELVFPAGSTGRIPIAVAAGGREASRVAQDLDAILRASGKRVGLATPERALVEGRPADIEEARLRHAPSILLRDPRVESLVAAVPLRQAVQRGLSLESCDVAAIVGAAEAAGVELIRRATRGMLVVGASDKAALRTLGALDPERVILTGSDPNDAAIASHAAAGGAVVLYRRQRDQRRIVLYRQGEEVVSIRIEAPAGERVSARRIEARLFAIAMAYGLGLTASELEAALPAARALSRPVARAIEQPA